MKSASWDIFGFRRSEKHFKTGFVLFVFGRNGWVAFVQGCRNFGGTYLAQRRCWNAGCAVMRLLTSGGGEKSYESYRRKISIEKKID